MKNSILVISNHPTEKWSDEQKKGWDIIDYIPFPNVPATATFEEVVNLSIPLLKEIGKWKNLHGKGKISIQGESTLSTILLTVIKEQEGWCFAFPTTERQVVEEVKDGKTVKKSVFHFVRWR